MKSRVAQHHDIAARSAGMGLFSRPLVLEAIGGVWGSSAPGPSTTLPTHWPLPSATRHPFTARAILKRAPGGQNSERSVLSFEVLSEDRDRARFPFFLSPFFLALVVSLSSLFAQAISLELLFAHAGEELKFCSQFCRLDTVC